MLEGERNCVAVVVNVGDRGALGGYLYVLIGPTEMEARISLGTCAGHVNGLVHLAVLDRDRLSEVVGLGGVRCVLVVVYILLPDEDRVARGGLRGPLGIEVGPRGDGLIERIRLRARLVGVPPSEDVALALHGLGRLHALVASLDELRRDVGPFVLVEDDPLALGSIDREDHVSADLHGGVVGVWRIHSLAFIFRV